MFFYSFDQNWDVSCTGVRLSEPAARVKARTPSLLVGGQTVGLVPLFPSMWPFFYVSDIYTFVCRFSAQLCVPLMMSCQEKIKGPRLLLTSLTQVALTSFHPSGRTGNLLPTCCKLVYTRTGTLDNNEGK